METGRSSETSVSYVTTQRHNTEDSGMNPFQVKYISEAGVRKGSFFLCQRGQTWSGAQIASCPMGTGDISLGSKAAGV